MNEKWMIWMTEIIRKNGNDWGDWTNDLNMWNNKSLERIKKWLDWLRYDWNG